VGWPLIVGPVKPGLHAHWELPLVDTVQLALAPHETPAQTPVMFVQIVGPPVTTWPVKPCWHAH
jgi:hypothetical protein